MRKARAVGPRTFQEEFSSLQDQCNTTPSCPSTLKLTWHKDSATSACHLSSNGRSSQWEHDTPWPWHPLKRVPLNLQWEGGVHCMDRAGLSGLISSCSLWALWDTVVQTEGESGLVQAQSPALSWATVPSRYQSMGSSLRKHPCSSAWRQPNGHQGVRASSVADDKWSHCWNNLEKSSAIPVQCCLWAKKIF